MFFFFGDFFLVLLLVGAAPRGGIGGTVALRGCKLGEGGGEVLLVTAAVVESSAVDSVGVDEICSLTVLGVAGEATSVELIGEERFVLFEFGSASPR